MAGRGREDGKKGRGVLLESAREEEEEEGGAAAAFLERFCVFWRESDVKIIRGSGSEVISRPFPAPSTFHPSEVCCCPPRPFLGPISSLSTPFSQESPVGQTRP